MANDVSEARPSKMKIWLAEVRAPFFTATVVPVLLGAVIAWARTGTFHLGLFVLTMLGALLLHTGTNVANDYFDHRSGTDDIRTRAERDGVNRGDRVQSRRRRQRRRGRKASRSRRRRG